MNVRLLPRNWMLTKGAMAVSSPPPNTSIQRKSALRPRKEPAQHNGHAAGHMKLMCVNATTGDAATQ